MPTPTSCLPLTDIEAAVTEADRAVKENALTYYRRFFYDTAVNGNTAALECGLAFAGLDQMVFATDMPFCNQMGSRLIRDTIESVNRMQITAQEKRKIFQENAVNLLRLPLNKF
jgi:aminocarboxymuconate-semialdehyde decarboxylase